MKTTTQAFASIIVGCSLNFALSGFGHTASIRSQTPCPAPPGGACITINEGTSLPITVRSFTFNAPVNSVGNIAFEGSMSCFEVASNQVTIDLATQISPSPDRAPDFNGPGALRHRATLGDLGTRVTFNLASSRVRPFPTGGNQTVHFRLGGTVPNFTSCEIYNAAFTVTLTP